MSGTQVVKIMLDSHFEDFNKPESALDLVPTTFAKTDQGNIVFIGMYLFLLIAARHAQFIQVDL